MGTPEEIAELCGELDRVSFSADKGTFTPRVAHERGTDGNFQRGSGQRIVLWDLWL